MVNHNTNYRTVFFIAAAVLVVGGAGYGIFAWQANQASRFGSWLRVDASDTRYDQLMQQAIEHDHLIHSDSDDVILLVASTDVEGNPLHPEEAYVIEGRKIDTHWRIFASHEHGVPDEQDAADCSLNSQTVVYEQDVGQYRIVLAKSRISKNWVSMGTAKEPVVVLCLFGPSDALEDNFSKDNLPLIKKIGRYQKAK